LPCRFAAAVDLAVFALALFVNAGSPGPSIAALSGK